MNLTQEQLGDVLGTPKATVKSYVRVSTPRTPTFTGLIAMSDRLCVSCDWLVGRDVTERWSQAVVAMRLDLRSRAADIATDDETKRIHRVMDMLGDTLPSAQEDWFCAGILGIAVEAYRRFREGEWTLGEHSLMRLSAFTHLPHDWFLLGNATALTLPDLSTYTRVVLRLYEAGVTPDDLDRQVDAIARRTPLLDELHRHSETPEN
jgi:hypothetical protein